MILPKNLDVLSSQSLAMVIVANRSVGLLKEEARIAMIELMKRQNSGDQFNFEEFISEKLLLIPKPEENVEATNVLSFLNKIGKV